MKTDIHPKVNKVKFICSCWNVVEDESAVKETEVRIEICSKCHPFYTWEQRILKTWAVDKFYARMKKTEKISWTPEKWEDKEEKVEAKKEEKTKKETK